jgi:acetolactate synthase-1/2/3 large subunit
LVREGVQVAFGITGGQIMPVYHELRGYPSIHHVTVRHEQGAAHAADGYARATGNVGVCIATSGPGATNLVTGIATAYMDSSPIVAITGQVSSQLLGSDAFQECDIVGMTMPITKHNYLVTDVADIAEAMREAFHIARTGRPGPVLVDITKDAQMSEVEFSYPERVNLPGYRPHTRGNTRQIAQAAEMLAHAQRPLIIAGRGCLIAGATPELRELVDKAQVPVITTLLGKSALPESHALCLGMAGMHGESSTNRTVQQADLILAVGTRFTDRLTGTNANSFAPDAKIIHVDVDPAEIGKRVRVDLPIVGDARSVLSQLVPLVKTADKPAWITQADLTASEQTLREHPVSTASELTPQYIMRTISEVTCGQAIMVSDVGQNQMWEAQYYSHDRPSGLITSGGLGAMGFALPAAIGVAMGRRDAPVWVVAGDGGFQMTMQELATIVQERLPIRIVILNNGYLGMVRQWQELFYDCNYAVTPIVGPDFAKIAAAYGITGLTVRDRCDVRSAVEAMNASEGPILVDFQIAPEHNVLPIVPLGKSIDDMVCRVAPDTSKRGAA